MDYSFEKSLGNISRLISKALGKKLEAKLTAHDIPITAKQWSVISLLFHKGELSQTDISKHFEIDKVEVLRIISSLEKEKLIERSTGKNDKRFKIVRLNQHGIEVYHKITPFAKETHKQAFKSISKKDITFCYEILEKINKNLN